MFRMVIAVLVALLAVGCGGGEDGGGMSTTFTTSTSTASTTTTTAPASPSTPVIVLGSGANAAPQPAGRIQPGELFNKSPEAAANFRLWIEYEMPPSYWNKYATSKVVADQLLTDGKAVCIMLSGGRQHETTVTVMQDLRFGHNKTEAEAIHMAAVQALCPHLMGGLPTTFDRNVEAAFGQLQSYQMADGSLLSRFDVGWAGKFSCHYLESGAVPASLKQWLRQYAGRVRVADPRVGERVLEQVVRAAVGQLCIPQMGKVQWS